jgi:hypothetical protein
MIVGVVRRGRRCGAVRCGAEPEESKEPIVANELQIQL